MERRVSVCSGSCEQRDFLRLRLFVAGAQAFECRQRLSDDLIHVVVLVSREPADERDVSLRVCFGFVALVERCVLAASAPDSRDRPRLADIRRRPTCSDALPGDVLELADARVGVVVGIVDGADRLKPFDRQRDVLETAGCDTAACRTGNRRMRRSARCRSCASTE